jgi:hypothetical protein
MGSNELVFRDRYKLLRRSFYELKASPCFAGRICCNCPIGIKDDLCKHALLLMEKEELIEKLPTPMEPAPKRGAPKRLRGGALVRETVA